MLEADISACRYQAGGDPLWLPTATTRRRVVEGRRARHAGAGIAKRGGETSASRVPPITAVPRGIVQLGVSCRRKGIYQPEISPERWSILPRAATRR